MLKRWRELDDLECVKMHGYSHKLAHVIGTHAYSKCLMWVGQSVMEGLTTGLESEVKPEQQKHMRNAFKVL